MITSQRPAEYDERIEKLIAAMSFTEKLAQLQIRCDPDPDVTRALVRGGIGAIFWPQGGVTATNELQAERGRDYNTVDAPEQRLRNVYLEPFRVVVEAGVGSVMAALSGQPMHAHCGLLTNVLKDEWGLQSACTPQRALTRRAHRK